MNETIFALATAPGRSAVAVLRLSGPAVRATLEELGAGPPPPRRASLRRLKGADGETLDEALVLWLPGPASFTGEDCAELHLHGGAAVVSAVTARLIALGLGPAEPGAFTRRAFEAGRLDLVQAEAVADLVDAETEAQRRQALEQLGGATSRRHEAWRAALTTILARLEAAIDFPDEDLPQDVQQGLRLQMTELAESLERAASDRRGERVRNGFRVALMGAPNAGKSSLFNALIGRDASIVMDVPGTTRDVIEAELVLAGRRVILADLAGLRASEDPIEKEGVRRAKAWGAQADMRLWLTHDPSGPVDERDFNILAKSDLASQGEGLRVSAVTGEGLEALHQEIERRAVASTSGNEAPATTRLRHSLALAEAAEALRNAALISPGEPELIGEEVRLAARAMQRLSGTIGAEDVLGEVFATFCIGK